jgi:pyruvate kinase
MIDAGVNVFRINFFHTQITKMFPKTDIIRGLNEEFIIQLQFSRFARTKTRVEVMKEDVVVNPGDIITFQTKYVPELQAEFT